MVGEASFLVVQFLEWIDARPRHIAETRAAWGSTSPLTCAWEDALSDGLVACGGDGTVGLTARGRARLSGEVQP